jgi:hypothetical protein
MIGLSQGLYWAKDRHVTVYWAKDRPVTRSVLGEALACYNACIERSIGLSQRLFSEGLAFHEAERENTKRGKKTADVHGALVDGSQRDKCKELCAKINGLVEIPGV